VSRAVPPPVAAALPPPGESWRIPLLAALALAVANVLLYWPSVDFALLAWDDLYFTRLNPLVQGGLDVRNVADAFRLAPGTPLYIPLAHLSYMADVSVFGMASRGFHLTNVLLHAISSGILLLVLWRATALLGESAFAAALFSFHPMRVESVAWVTERKGLLAFLFLLAALACWLRWVREGKARWYLLAMASFLLGLLSKPILVTFPVLLLFLDLWPLGRLFPAPATTDRPVARGEAARTALRLLLEKVPFLVPAAAVSLVTWRLQAMAIHEGVSAASRLEHSLVAPFLYLGRTLWPVHLPYLFFDAPWNRYAGLLLPAAAATAAVAAVALRRLRTAPWVAAGLGWYAAALFPTGGVSPAGAQWISDRFSHVPHLGLALAGIGLFAASCPKSRRRAGGAAALLLLVLLAAATRGRLSDWKDGPTLFGRSLAANGGDFRFAGQYVQERIEAGDLAGALQAIAPLLPRALEPGAGVEIQLRHLAILERLGDRKGAIEAAKEYLRRDPGFWKTRMVLGDFLLAEGRDGEAAEEYRRVLALGTVPPLERANLSEGLGIALAALGRREEAVAAFREGLALQPQRPSLHYHLALALSDAGEGGAAQGEFVEALRLAPGDVRILLAWADHLARMGDRARSAAVLEEVALRFPGSAEAFLARGRFLESRGEGGREAYEAALAAPALLPETHESVRKRLARAS
jgi:tetratricopeptide (TPR) repeat protein